jgi:molecular chaperone DnaK
MVYGIDLGTTQSCVARIDETGKPAIVKNEAGEDTTPSVVWFESPDNVIIGRAALNQSLVEPDQVAQLVKRDMGTSARYTFHGQRHTPETVSALILRELASVAKKEAGEPVRDVVITVPAYFGVAEREATRRAGQLAGLTVLDVLQEPVAAAMHYQAVSDSAGGPRHILVCDLGGGTYDTTVIRLDGDDITVVCTDGDPRLGGADWDQAIATYLRGQFTAEHPELRPERDAQFLQDLLIDAERLKRELSAAQSRRYIARFGGQVTRVELTRETVERLTEDLLDKVIAVTERTTAAARRMGVAAFDEVLLVGGMTRFPAVARALKERLGLETRLHEPELAVAKGAALFALLRTVRPAVGPAAAAADVAAATGLSVPQVERLSSAKVATVVPRGFGVRGIDARDPLAITDPARARQIVLHLLPANTPLPADTGPFTFYTAAENQRVVGIEVWEQAGPVESEDPSENRKIGEGTLRNLPARLPSRSPFEVTFYMSETGQLTVHAIEPGSESEVRFELQIGDLNPAEMEKARQSVARYGVSG